MATPCRRPELARLLVARGATYDVTIAAALGNLDQVTAMLDADPSRISESRPDARRPLTAAAEFGRLDIVELLLARGADPTWPDVDESERGAALHAAVRAGNLRMVELLLRHGADPNGYVNAGGNSVFAARTPAIRKLLVEHGGRLDPFDLVFMDEDDEAMRIITADPATALAGCGGVFPAVVTKGNRKLLNRLLDAGIKVHPHPQTGGCHSYLLEHPDRLRELLQRGGLDPNYPTEDAAITLLHELCSRDVRGRTMKHRTECAAILLEAGADLSPRTLEGETPLAWAVKNNLPDMVDFLKARHAKSEAHAGHGEVSRQAAKTPRNPTRLSARYPDTHRKRKASAPDSSACDRRRTAAAMEACGNRRRNSANSRATSCFAPHTHVDPVSAWAASSISTCTALA